MDRNIGAVKRAPEAEDCEPPSGFETPAEAEVEPDETRERRTLFPPSWEYKCRGYWRSSEGKTDTSTEDSVEAKRATLALTSLSCRGGSCPEDEEEAASEAAKTSTWRRDSSWCRRITVASQYSSATRARSAESNTPPPAA